MTSSSDRFKGHSRSSPSGGDEPSAGQVEEEDVEAAARAGFGDRLVPKGWARGLAQRHPVPYYLAESLLARYRAQGDSKKEAARNAGRALGNRLARAEDVELFKARASREGAAEVIDHVEAKFDSGRGEPVASLSRLGLSKLPLEGGLAEEHDRLLKGGFYAEVQLEYADTGGSSPFRIGGLEPVRASVADPLDQIQEGRSAFSNAAWLYFLARSVGLTVSSDALGPRALVRFQSVLLGIGSALPQS